MKYYFFICFVLFNTILSMGCTPESKASTKEQEKPKVETKFERQEREKIELRLKAQTMLQHKRAEYCKAAYNSSYNLVSEMKKLESLLRCLPGRSSSEYRRYKSKGCYFENNSPYGEITLKKRKDLVENQKQQLLTQKKKIRAELEQFLHEGYFCIGIKPDNGDQHQPKGLQESRYNDIIDLIDNPYSADTKTPDLQKNLLDLERNLKEDSSTEELEAETYSKLEMLQHLMQNWEATTAKTIEEWKYN